MNKKLAVSIIISVLLILGLLINACKEINPPINSGTSGALSSSTYIESPAQAPEPKNVLIEEMTGVSCNNCPPAHIVLDNLITTNNNHVIGVSYHIGGATFNQDALPQYTRQDMSSVDALTVVNAFTYPGYGPAGSVDRIVHQNAGPFSVTSIWDVYANWGGYVSTELAATNPPPVNIYIASAYSASSKQINISVSLHYTAAQTDSDRLSIFLTEDSIITAQLLPNGSNDTTYMHMHIMRAAVSNPLGDNINVPSLVAGRVDSLGYTFTLTPADSLWKPAHLNVVAFVHKYQNNRSDILQAKMIKVIP
jgi:hypothetical protein